jgi:hypothetical protein
MAQEPSPLKQDNKTVRELQKPLIVKKDQEGQTGKVFNPGSREANRLAGERTET